MHRLFPPLGGSMQTFGCSLSRDEVSSSGVRARSANIKQTVDGNTETERADCPLLPDVLLRYQRASCLWIPAVPASSSVLLVRTGQ